MALAPTSIASVTEMLAWTRVVRSSVHVTHCGALVSLTYSTLASATGCSSVLSCLGYWMSTMTADMPLNTGETSSNPRDARYAFMETVIASTKLATPAESAWGV